MLSVAQYSIRPWKWNVQLKQQQRVLLWSYYIIYQREILFILYNAFWILEILVSRSTSKSEHTVQGSQAGKLKSGEQSWPLPFPAPRARNLARKEGKEWACCGFQRCSIFLHCPWTMCHFYQEEGPWRASFLGEMMCIVASFLLRISIPVAVKIKDLDTPLAFLYPAQGVFLSLGEMGRPQQWPALQVLSVILLSLHLECSQRLHRPLGVKQ